MSLENYLESARSSGKHDSEGSFTIGWQRALEKLKTYRAVDPTSYLLILVSAGRAYGARNISISEAQDRVSLTMHECYVSESAVRSGFHSVISGGFQHQAFDLASGLHGGLQLGFAQVELTSVHKEQPSYSWRLSLKSEEQAEAVKPEEKALTTVCFTRNPKDTPFLGSLWKRLFGSSGDSRHLGGYVGLSEAARLVDRRCDLSDIPITINQTMINRPYHFARSPIALEIGEVDGVRLNSYRVLRVDKEGLRGALAFQSGPLKIVVNGLTFDAGIHPEVTGVLWTELHRDLSRERLLQDQTYERFTAELQTLIDVMEAEEDSLF